MSKESSSRFPFSNVSRAAQSFVLLNTSNLMDGPRRCVIPRLNSNLEGSRIRVPETSWNYLALKRFSFRKGNPIPLS